MSLYVVIYIFRFIMIFYDMTCAEETIYMVGEKFKLMQYSISSVLGMIDAGQFVIPEIQRPFVWKRSQVRDLIDSLYNGYPTGYIITWKNPDVRTKDGVLAGGNHVLIDGQQRITSLMAAISGIEVLDEDFNKERIKIAFNPLTNDPTKTFAVQDASHLKDKKWIPDISLIFKSDFKQRAFENEYAKNNEGVDIDELSETILKLKGIANRQIGVIELEHTLDIDEVTEIFIRINSKGTALSQSDFVMSKMAADSVHGGNSLRKVVDYFCHLAVKPEFYSHITKDLEFQKTEFASKIKWLTRNSEDIYTPDYGDMLRVAFMYSFNRGKLADLVSLLSGRDFETREYKEEIVEDSYNRLKDGISKYVNEYNFEQFLLAIKGAGFKSSKQLNSQMTLDFAYLLYLKLHDDKDVHQGQIKRLIQKWFVLSTLTGRYVGSPESVMSRDIRLIVEKGFYQFAKETEESVLSDTFWRVTLPQNLETTSVNSPAFNVFLAAQDYMKSSSMLMKGTMISDLITISGDVHHIFPKAYLKKNGVDNKGRYNQVANFTYLDTQVNKAIGDAAPFEYFGLILNQCKTKDIIIGNISEESDLIENLTENAIPESVIKMDVSDYDDFLVERRKLMAAMIEKYYKSL